MLGKGSVRERERRTPRTGPISPRSHRNKHKTPRSSVQGSCGKVLHVAGHSTGQTQQGPERLSHPPSTPAMPGPGSHLASIVSLAGSSLSQRPRPRLPDPGPEGCARAAGLLQWLQLPDEPARGAALPPCHPGGYLRSPRVSQQQGRNICSCSGDGAGPPWERGGFWWGQGVNPQ